MNASVLSVADGLSPAAQARRDEQLLSVLEPLARIARRNGFNSAAAIALFREAFISATRADTSIRAPNSDARVAVEAEVTRSAVEQSAAAKDARDRFIQADRAAKLIATKVANAWTNDQRCSAPYGAALPLRFARDPHARGTSSERPTFSELVKEVEPSADPLAVASSLTEVGMAAWSGDSSDDISLAPEFTSILDHGTDSTFWYVTNTLSGLAHTLATNAYGLYVSPRLCERRAVSDRVVDQNTLIEVNELLRAKLIGVLDSALGDLERPRESEEFAPVSANRFRMSVGVYVMADGIDRDRPPLKNTSVKHVRTIDLASPNAARDSIELERADDE
jgi:hypothetical protein